MRLSLLCGGTVRRPEEWSVGPDSPAPAGGRALIVPAHVGSLAEACDNVSRSSRDQSTKEHRAMAKLEAGATAPAFTLPDQDGKPIKLSDYKGQRVIVYFYPADDTPGCTKEACQFNDNLRAFDKAGVAVVGISPDGAEKHRRFAEKYRLRFPLLSDPTHVVMEKYGAWGE